MNKCRAQKADKKSVASCGCQWQKPFRKHGGPFQLGQSEQQQWHSYADKKYHSKKWIKEEKQQGIVIENLLGMHGLLQEQTGNALQEIPGLEYVEEDHH